MEGKCEFNGGIQRRRSQGCGCMSSASSHQDVRVQIPSSVEETAEFTNGRVMSSESLQTHLANQRKAVRIDEFCRIIFPVGFIIFNLCYWNYYQSDFEEDDK